MRFAAFCLLCLASVFSHADGARFDLSPANLDPAPPLVLNDLDGKPVDLAQFKGRVVLVNFWATWCPPCRREMPSLQRLYKSAAGQPFVVLAVSIGEDPDTVRDFLTKLDPTPTFPVVLDTRNTAMRAWKVSGLPYTVVVDREGRVAYTAAGGREFDHPEMAKTLRALLPE
jgi:thiol-disulfide isomerase/thioredoxin